MVEEEKAVWQVVKKSFFVCKPKARISFAVPKKELLAYEQL